MNLSTFKDLTVGDLVEFKDVSEFGKKISGQGKVFGFGKISFTDIVWVTMDDGKTHGIPYEEVTKI